MVILALNQEYCYNLHRKKKHQIFYECKQQRRALALAAPPALALLITRYMSNIMIIL